MALHCDRGLMVTLANDMYSEKRLTDLPIGQLIPDF